jgi:IS5 family transposase
VLKGEVISHAEKIFSIIEPHAEWFSKGKAGVPVELGLSVCVVEDQYRFILHHQVMEKKTDDQVAVPITTAAKTRIPTVQSISFDKGFHSPANQTELPAIVGQVACPGRANSRRPSRPLKPRRTSFVCAATIRRSSRRSTPWSLTAWTAAQTMDSMAFRATWL